MKARVYVFASDIEGVITTEMEFYRTDGFTAVTVSNDVAENAESSKPIFQLLALVCSSDHPERLFAPEPW